MQALKFFLIVLCFARDILTQNTYRAAVLEYTPKLHANTPEERILDNTREYINYIEQAADQNVNIIVFPEDGLTGWKDISYDNLEQFSTEVPDPSSQMISPCTTFHHNYSKSFIDLSCATQTHKVYAAVNLIEKEYDHKTNKKIYYNTNVVFDKNGGIIARFRKINLFNEPLYEPGTKPVTFKTDFGVTFGMFICFDILFKNPALDVLSDPSVTDIIYSVAWFSELPFLEALSTQHGYAISNGVNLLSSGYDNPEAKNGGSGIFLADGRIAEMYISGAKRSKMLIQDIPKITARHGNSCQMESSFAVDSKGVPVPDISTFHTWQENMTHYVFKSLNMNSKTISETICSNENELCCSFKITIAGDATKSNYVYKLAAFYGVRAASLTRTLGIHNCGLVACLNESTTSCGLRKPHASEELIFESIAIKGTFDSDNAHAQPATLKYDLTPIVGYRYCTKVIANNKVEVTMETTQPQNSLLTFGIFGRVFSNDDKPVTNNAFSFNVNVACMVTIIMGVFLLEN